MLERAVEQLFRSADGMHQGISRSWESDIAVEIAVEINRVSLLIPRSYIFHLKLSDR